MRIGTPTPEQIEAAMTAHRAHGRHVEEGGTWWCPECDGYFEGREGHRSHRWRAALVAAAGVAPQSEARAWERGVRDAVDAISAAHGTLTYVAPHNPWGATAALAAPGQVDEVKLAEIARSVDSHEWSRMGGSQGEQVADIVRDVMRGGGQ